MILSRRCAGESGRTSTAKNCKREFPRRVGDAQREEEPGEEEPPAAAGSSDSEDVGDPSRANVNPSRDNTVALRCRIIAGSRPAGGAQPRGTNRRETAWSAVC
jgi:hypothetical protein